MRPVPDPYRVLGVSRSASAAQIKAAHRRLAKRYHPDAPEADTERFLTVQGAYALLSDPVARRDWDTRHAPGPVRPGQGTTARPRPAAGRWTREQTEPGVRRPPRPAKRPPPAAETSSQSGRDPSERTYTWSASGVPWWEDFRGPRPPMPPADAPASPPGAAPEAQPGTPMDVYDRSSGAAWSMAARRHFRKGDLDLPSRGVFQRRGTEYVTGARARELADEPTETILRPRPGPLPPRQALDHDPVASPRRPPPSRAAPPPSRAVPPPTGRAPPPIRPAPPPTPPAMRREGTVVGSLAPRVAAPPEVGQRIAQVVLAWAPLAAIVGAATPVAADCSAARGDCPDVLLPAQAAIAAVLLAVFVLVPRLARAGAVASVAGLAVAVPLGIAAAALGVLPAPPILIAGLTLVALAYLGAGLWALLGTRARSSARA